MPSALSAALAGFNFGSVLAADAKKITGSSR